MASVEPRGAGYATFQPTEVNLGPLPWMSENPFALTLHNGRAEDVRIAALQPACGCTVMDEQQYVGTVIPSGGSLTLEGMIDAGAREGRHSKRVDVLLENGAVVSGFLNFETYATYDYKPTALTFERVSLDEPAEHHRKILFTSRSASLIGRPEADVPWIRTGVQRREGGETDVFIHIATEHLRWGDQSGRVAVRTDDPWRPEFSIPVTVHATAALRPVPGHVFLQPGARSRVRSVDARGRIQPLAALEAPEGLSAELSSDSQSVAVAMDGAFTGDTGRIEVTDREGRRSHVMVTRVRLSRGLIAL